MQIKSNVVTLAAFKNVSAISEPDHNSQKTLYQDVEPESGKGLENKGLQAAEIDLPSQGSEENLNPHVKKKKVGTSKVKGKKKAFEAAEVPGPYGHVHDANTLDATSLQHRYPLTYSSWKNRKSACNAARRSG